MNEALPNVEQLFVRHIMWSSRDGFEPDIGSDPIERQQKPSGNFILRQGLSRRCGWERFGESNTQINFFQHIQQTRHWPPPRHFLLQSIKHGWIILRAQWFE